jgi:predicted nuclease of predicted toxin-antitoxin system
VRPIRLLLDEDVPLPLAEASRRHGGDAVHAIEEGLKQHDDDVVLAAAVAAGRAVLTHNVRDFAPLAQEYARASRVHHGIILSNQEPFRELFRRTLLLFATRTQDDIDGTVDWLPR